MHAEAFELVNKETVKLYWKRNHDVRDASIINEYLRNLRNSHMEAEDKPVRTDDITLDDVDPKYHAEIRAMIRKHQEMWNGCLGEVTITKHKIDLVEGPRPVKARPYRQRTKERVSKEFEIHK